MLVLGIDPGTASMGYGLVLEKEDGSLAAVDFGVIQTQADLPKQKRLLKQYNELSKIIALHQPESGAVEKLFFARNTRTAMAVGEARGVAILVLSDMGREVYEYTPLQIKQAVTGYGGASKGQIQEMVRTLLGLDSIPKPDDAADALAVAICHIHSNRIRFLLEQLAGE